MKTEPDNLELIRRYIDGDASEADRQALQEELRCDPTTRRLFARYANIDATLGGGSITLKEPVLSAKTLRTTWLSWRPLTAAAAGIVLGMFCTSMVFAYAAPQFGLHRALVASFFEDGFEVPQGDLRKGFPQGAGAWSGDLDAVVPSTEGVLPVEGKSMIRLAPREDRGFSAMARIFDLAELFPSPSHESTAIEVSASFHGSDAGALDRNQIRIAAFFEKPEDVRTIWNNDPRLEKALLHTARTVKMQPGDHGWQTLKIEMEIPTGTRSLVIYLGTGMADDLAPKGAHYVDDVQVNTITQETHLP
ncbi:MAG: hypothetical protein NTV80_25905 [Verrucomicrobia bacterium]|nr:hypothetical protein [Verrucomicrobiota bacterium]